MEKICGHLEHPWAASRGVEGSPSGSHLCAQRHSTTVYAFLHDHGDSSAWIWWESRRDCMRKSYVQQTNLKKTETTKSEYGKNKNGKRRKFYFLICKKNGKTKKQKNAKSKKTQKQNKRGKKGKIGKSKRETKWETNMHLPIFAFILLSRFVFFGFYFAFACFFQGKKAKKCKIKAKKQIEETK